ncbi:hypothetical protein PGTUg99_011883 [Puccinia graminis f. sp. tritici]|uniref:Uncharacterized protein n=2 Tax=Puccinia graminis f. sp. tritici TaxID=56615 RepID=A0A5B0RT16_PUCGR|nr:hypothetical protein PGTUg99_011883 [Puccinia graminis f. sp. tritici]
MKVYLRFQRIALLVLSLLRAQQGTAARVPRVEMMAKDIITDPAITTRSETLLPSELGSLITLSESDRDLSKKIATLQVQKNQMEKDFTVLKFNLQMIIHKSGLGNLDQFDQERNAILKQHAEQLASVQRFIAFQTQAIIFELKSAMKKIRTDDIFEEYFVNDHQVLPTFLAKSRTETSGMVELNQHVMLMIDKVFLDDMIKNWNKILHKLNSLKNGSPYHERNGAVTELQSIVFQQIHYMYKYKFISEFHFRKFLKMENTIELAAKNLIETSKMKYRNCAHHSIFASRKLIHRNMHYAHFRSFFKVLDDHDQRYFCFLAIKEFLEYHMVETQHFKESSWSDDLLQNKLFLLLEDWLEKTRKSLSKHKSGDEIQTRVEPLPQFYALKEVFNVENADTFEKMTIDRIISFFVLEFHEENYGNYFSKEEIENQKLPSKLSVISSIFESMEEVKNIRIKVKESISSKALGSNFCFICKEPHRTVENYGKEISRIYRKFVNNMSKIHQFSHQEDPEIYFLGQVFSETKESIRNFVENSNLKCEHQEKGLVKGCNLTRESKISPFSVINFDWNKLRRFFF